MINTSIGWLQSPSVFVSAALPQIKQLIETKSIFLLEVFDSYLDVSWVAFVPLCSTASKQDCYVHIRTDHRGGNSPSFWTTAPNQIRYSTVDQSVGQNGRPAEAHWQPHSRAAGLAETEEEYIFQPRLKNLNTSQSDFKYLQGRKNTVWMF